MDYEETQGGFLISTDKSKLDIQVIHKYLSEESYWSRNIPFATVQKGIEGSICFGLYHQQKQIGFARVVTDGASFAWLADVFVLEQFRGKGLSKWMMKFILAHPGLQGLRRWMLGTKDAHGLYSQFGFKALENPERIMGLILLTQYPAVKNEEGK
jgi:GNAT superfamily N-acetyltransferase